MHIVSKCQVTRNQPSRAAAVEVRFILGIDKCAAIGVDARSMLAGFGMRADVVVHTGSSSGLAVGSRRGLGRFQHVLQQRVQEGDLRLKKEPGDTNVSDALLGRTLIGFYNMVPERLW